MTDDKLYFSDGQVVNTDEVADYYLDVKDIEEIGRGSQVFIEVWVSDAYTAASAALISVDLVTSTAAPDSGDAIMTIVQSATANTSTGPLCSTGLIAKVPLPSTGLEDHISLSYRVGTVDPSNGKITAFLSIQ